MPVNRVLARALDVEEVAVQGEPRSQVGLNSRDQHKVFYKHTFNR